MSRGWTISEGVVRWGGLYFEAVAGRTGSLNCRQKKSPRTAEAIQGAEGLQEGVVLNFSG